MFEDFERYLRTQDRPPTTIRSYLSDLRQFAAWFEQTNGEPPTLRTITPTDLREYRQYMLTVQRLAPSTINRRLASLSAYLSWGEQNGLIEDNPARQVRPVKRQDDGPRWLTKREQRKLEREAEKAVLAARTETARRRALRDAALVKLMLNTGLRVGEVCALRLDDLALSERKGAVTVRAGKGNKTRTVPLNRLARRALQAWLDVRPEAETDHVFLGQRGEPLTPSALRRRIAELARRAGVQATPHTLRHTFGKRLVDGGVSLEKVAALLGHSSLNTTRLYVLPGKHDLETAVEVLE